MAKDPKEYGYEGEMVMSQLKGIMNHASQMHNMLKPDTDLPEWVQSKVTLAYDYMQTAADYISTEMNEEIDKGLEDELMSQRQGQSGKKWRVTRANKTIGTYNSKDKADVKAMKHPLNKVVANEEAPVNAAGAGNVAGLGVGPQGEPGVKKKKKVVLASFKRFASK